MESLRRRKSNSSKKRVSVGGRESGRWKRVSVARMTYYGFIIPGKSIASETVEMIHLLDLCLLVL